MQRLWLIFSLTMSLWALPVMATDAKAPFSFDTQTISQARFVAELYVPDGVVSPPLVIVLGGSSGGMRTARGQSLAAQGVAALSLAYFREQHLPTTLDNIPVESVIDAIDHVATMSAFSSSRVAVWGASRGSELAFLAASHDPRIEAVIATSPSTVAWHGATTRHAWTWKGQPVSSLSFPRQSGHSIYQRAEQALTDPKAVDQAQFNWAQINGPLLLITGARDRIWPSYDMVLSMGPAFQHFEHAVTHYTFQAGHTFDSSFDVLFVELVLEHLHLAFASEY